MPLPLKFRVLAYKESGLKNAPHILFNNLRGALEVIGKRLRTSAQSRMREQRGVTKNSLRITVGRIGYGLRLEVFTTLVQAFVDAYGITRGKIFPPFRRGTNLHAWAVRRASGIQSKPVQGITRGERSLSHLSRRPRLGQRRKKRVLTSQEKLQSWSLLDKPSKRQRAINSDANRIAFLAARAIYEHGIKPTHWNSKALEANKARIVRELKNAISRSVNQINRG